MTRDESHLLVLAVKQQPLHRHGQEGYVRQLSHAWISCMTFGWCQVCLSYKHWATLAPINFVEFITAERCFAQAASARPQWGLPSEGTVSWRSGG